MVVFLECLGNGFAQSRKNVGERRARPALANDWENLPQRSVNSNDDDKPAREEGSMGNSRKQGIVKEKTMS